MSSKVAKTSPGLGSKAGYPSNDVQCKCSEVTGTPRVPLLLSAVHKDRGVTKEHAC